MSRLSCIFLLVFSFMTEATTFKLQSIATQVKDSQGIILGHYLRKKTVQLEDGKVATQMIFKMNKEFGLESELFGQDEVIIHYPGGSVEGKHILVEGVPTFIPGEKVVLLTKTINNRYWGMNLGFGTFKVINFGKETLLINTLFPNDPRVSQMKLEDFERTVKSIKGSNLKVVQVPLESIPEEVFNVGRVPASIEEEGKNRTIASHSEQRENDETQPRLNIFWLVVIFALLGGLFTFFRQKKAK